MNASNLEAALCSAAGAVFGVHLARHIKWPAGRRGRLLVVVGLVVGAVALVVAVALAGCGVDAPPPAPDAAPPTCAELGCPGPVLCNVDGSCTCRGVECRP